MNGAFRAAVGTARSPPVTCSREPATSSRENSGRAGAGERLSHLGPAPEDPGLIFISSGTTGAPKATLGYHGNLVQSWQRLVGWLRFTPEDVHLAYLPCHTASG